MNLVEFSYWESVIYSVIVWIAVFVLMDIERIKALWPIGILSSGLMLSSHFFLISLGLSHFNEGFLTLAGIPVFHLVWSFGAGILLIGLLPKNFYAKATTIIVFGLLTLFLDMLSVKVGGHVHQNLSFLNSFIFILYRLIAIVWVAEELLGEKMYKKSYLK